MIKRNDEDEDEGLWKRTCINKNERREKPGQKSDEENKKQKQKNERLLRFACAARVREVHACACMCACAKVACMPRAPGAPVRHAVRDLVRACVRSRGTIVASRGQGTKHHVEGTLFS